MTSPLDRFREKFPLLATIQNGTEGNVYGYGAEKLVESFLTTALAEEYARGREDVLKEVLLHFHKNQLEGKGFDWFFVLSSKLDELKALTTTGE